MMNIDGYITMEAHEKYLDNLALSIAMCNDKVRRGECLKAMCPRCEKRRMIDECREQMDTYSRLVLIDKVEMETARLHAMSPSVEEIEESMEIERRARRKAVINAQRELNHTWFFHEMGWFYVLLVILVPIIIPIVLTGEWFL